MSEILKDVSISEKVRENKKHVYRLKTSIFPLWKYFLDNIISELEIYLFVFNVSWRSINLFIHYFHLFSCFLHLLNTVKILQCLCLAINIFVFATTAFNCTGQQNFSLLFFIMLLYVFGEMNPEKALIFKCQLFL